ncbi:hypothetical protein RhiirA5_359424 [Rhizophagus irregularis]|uniref:Uncharacterized protein n=2 Tax=Rhizophagus irregularis TaxID=588596 RepID=A0A2I1FBU1_9GLOM|nr:hypothetical protein RhiirA5_359424 [Rhizophagus irregularis]PKY31859.1 hypothetical protein RhiirB3_419796 [Rhizophagus irregularis]GBC38569.1 hypothetical protein RIR_e74123_A0A2I1FBU1_9GLOM [Rhizophagus irregularis DAOM 181602=DAOM 197198]
MIDFKSRRERNPCDNSRYSWCGNIQNIGGLETYKCKNCRDRDVNGAPRDIPSGFVIRHLHA